jgi:pimeloyl-ACP methyl ester carboxylesterase
MMSATGTSNVLLDYLNDAWQRSALFLDVLRQRGDNYLERTKQIAPNVLNFEFELIADGTKLDRPVNYMLVRIIPPAGVRTDPKKRPFVVVDPRAGHGPGIGGMKQESQIGVALAAGHTCYFIGFLPEPLPDQTIEDVWNAQAQFIREVAKLHPEADCKPAVIANCQAGWQTMIMAATHPDVAGPLLIVGAPLSYWAGVRGKNPMRYLGGMLGRTWLTALTGDMGAGKFDGANLVANFESQDLAHTYWDKPYNVYSKVDTEAPRFLDFESWWGNPALLNAKEMEWISGNLFVGNKLTRGILRTSDGGRIDLRNIRSPIIVFCSWGDNITPPQQALGWITDIYREDRELVSSGQTIVYTLHQSVGHLGIFVSSKVASKEHGKFASAMDMIDLLPPGLYEAVITEVEEDTANSNLIDGKYLLRVEARSLGDIRALGENSPVDDLAFATAARVSEINKRLYETFVRPVVSSICSEGTAAAARSIHPSRMRFAAFSSKSPAMAPIQRAAEDARKDRKPVTADNPFLAAEKTMAASMSSWLSAAGKLRDQWMEQSFFALYNSPLLHALTGLKDENVAREGQIERDASREAAIDEKRERLEERFDQGGVTEAALRALAFIGLADGSADERGFAVLREFHDAQPPGRQRSLAEIKDVLRDQYLLVRLDEERAVSTLAALLPKNAEERGRILRGIRRVVTSRGELPAEAKRRLKRIELLFEELEASRQPKETQDAGA